MNRLHERREPAVSEDDHRVEDTQRHLLPRKPYRELTVMRVLGEEWEFIDSRGNRFVRVLNGKEDTWYSYAGAAKQKPVQKVRSVKTSKRVAFCCKRLRTAWGEFVDIGRRGPSTERMQRITIFDKEARRTTAIDFCPFCGKELQPTD